MQIQINSDKNIAVDDRVVAFVRGEAERVLGRYEGRLTRLTFHLSDANGHKFGALDKRCSVEARPAGRQPLAVMTAAANVRAAVHGSLSKLRSALEKYFGRSEKGSKAESARRTGKPAATGNVPTKRAVAKETTGSAEVASSSRGPKKKATYQARRKSWPMHRSAAG